MRNSVGILSAKYGPSAPQDVDSETGEERAELLAPKLSIAETSVQRACTLLPGKTSRRLAGGSFIDDAGCFLDQGAEACLGERCGRVSHWRTGRVRPHSRSTTDTDARVESASISSLLARDRVRRPWGR